MHAGLSSLLCVPFRLRLVQKSTYLQGIASRLINMLETIWAEMYPTKVACDNDEAIIDLLQ